MDKNNNGRKPENEDNGAEDNAESRSENISDNTENNSGSSADNNAPVPPEPQKPKRKRKKLWITLGVILGVVVLLCGGVFAVVHSYLSKINYLNGDNDSVETFAHMTATEAQIPHDEDENAGPDSSDKDIQKAEDEIQNNLDDTFDLIADDNVMNILLIGSDTRTAGVDGRSDTMILLSINRNTDQLILTSIMRDIYTYIPGYYNTRINTAYALGGESLLKDTIETNFKIAIDRTASIDFYAFVDVIDAMGGVTVDLNEDERWGINKAIKKYNKQMGLSLNSDLIGNTGDVLLNGKQALGYVRNRNYPMGDFDRTEHQRKLISIIIDRMKTLSLTQIDEVLDVLLPNITTDFTETEILSLAIQIPSLLQYELVSNRLPEDGTYEGLTIGGASMLGIDYDENISQLKEIIYGE